MVGTRVSMTSTDISSPYQPDRDAERTAYESEEGWALKYHDIKTRRDTADARAKVCAACGLRVKHGGRSVVGSSGAKQGQDREVLV